MAISLDTMLNLTASVRHALGLPTKMPRLNDAHIGQSETVDVEPVLPIDLTEPFAK